MPTEEHLPSQCEEGADDKPAEAEAEAKAGNTRYLGVCLLPWET